MEFKDFEAKVYDFCSKVLEIEHTKNSPEMVSAISELISSVHGNKSDVDHDDFVTGETVEIPR